MRLSGKTLLSTAAVGLVTFGVVAPAFAGSRSGTTSNWTDGDTSSSWSDPGKNGAITSVTFYKGCKHDFDARIRQEHFGPDSTTGSERINCTSYQDTVYGGDLDDGGYHFDVHGYYLTGGYIVYPKLSGNYLIKW